MAHLIDKEALIAEIKHHLQFIPEHTNAFIEGEEHAYNKILSFINSQEVKAERDLELTWKDLALIEKIGNDFIKKNDTPMDDKEFFEEVLKQFKEIKEK